MVIVKVDGANWLVIQWLILALFSQAPCNTKLLLFFPQIIFIVGRNKLLSKYINYFLDSTEGIPRLHMQKIE